MKIRANVWLGSRASTSYREEKKRKTLPNDCRAAIMKTSKSLAPLMLRQKASHTYALVYRFERLSRCDRRHFLETTEFHPFMHDLGAFFLAIQAYEGHWLGDRDV